MIAEIQQASDVTFRLYDWNRMGTDGKPRPLHVEQALEVIDYQRGPIDPQKPRATERRYVSRLAECDKFVLDRWEFDAPQPVGGDERFHMVSVLHGAIEVAGDPTHRPLNAGQTILLPAEIGRCQLVPDGQTTLLDIYLP